MLRDHIRAGEVTLGSWITIGHPAIAEIMAKAGFDWLVVDLEHSAISIDQAAELIRVIDLCGCAPLVRLTSNDAAQIKRVMDAGAHGIVVPMVNSASEARHAVAATRYAPAGSRGVGLARAQGYGTTFAQYLEWQKDGAIVIVQIEHKDSLDNLEAILTEPGVTGMIIGPYDLSCSLGIPGAFERTEFRDCMEQILRTAKSLNVPAGIHIVEPNLKELDDAIAAGYTFIAYSVDIRVLDVTLRKAIKRGETARA